MRLKTTGLKAMLMTDCCCTKNCDRPKKGVWSTNHTPDIQILGNNVILCTDERVFSSEI